MFIKTNNPSERKNSLRNNSLAGFTLMEIVVGLIILATVFGGLTATFVGVKRYVARASRRLTAVNLGRQVLNALYTYVRADTWDTGVLAVTGADVNCTEGNVQVPNVTAAIDGFAYGPNTYIVKQVGTGTDTRQYREATVTITYPAD